MSPASVTEAEVVRRIEETADRLRAAGWTELGHLPDTEDGDAGFPYWRVEHGELVLRVRERGRLLDERRTTSVDQLVEWIFDRVAHSLAARWGLRHRVRGRDSRRVWFPLWVEMMKGLDPAWGRSTQAYVDEVLSHRPYGDG